MQLTAIIVEDEPLSRIFLENLVSEFCPAIRVVAAVSNEVEAVAAIQNLQPDLIFLDIELQHGTGFDVLQGLTGEYPLVVFVTAFDHHAIKAIEFSGVDYLLKPVDVDDLRQTLGQICARKNTGEMQMAVQHLLHTIANDDTPTHLAIRTENGLEFILLADITRLEGGEHETRLVLRTGDEKICAKSLKEFDALLKGNHFLRTHHAHMINIHEISGGYDAGMENITMNNGSSIPVSPRKQGEIAAILKSK